jgi:hypothetical protein
VSRNEEESHEIPKVETYKHRRVVDPYKHSSAKFERMFGPRKVWAAPVFFSQGVGLPKLAGGGIWRGVPVQTFFRYVGQTFAKAYPYKHSWFEEGG